MAQSEKGFMQGVNKAFSPRKAKDPREESFWDMIYINLFPHLTLYSFSFIFASVLLIIFLVQVFLCGINMLGKFLEVWHLGVTERMILEKSIYLFASETYRVFTSFFVHGDMPATSMSIILLLVWGSALEHKIGFFKTILVFFLCAITANFYGLYFSTGLEEVVMGSDGGAFGLFGAAFGYTLLNWGRIRSSVLSKFAVLFSLAIIFFFSFLFSNSFKDPLKQLFGCLAGILLGLGISPIISTKRQ